jgi:hypothetical protein
MKFFDPAFFLSGLPSNFRNLFHYEIPDRLLFPVVQSGAGATGNTALQKCDSQFIEAGCTN